MLVRFYLTFCIILSFCTSQSWAQEVLTNQSILTMHSNKVASGIMVSKISGSQCQFDMTTTGLLQLLDAKVNSSVIEAMMRSTKMTDVLTNTDIIKLWGANLPRKLMTQKINESSNQFDLTTNGLIQLKIGKVPEAIQKVMMAAPTTQPSNKSTSSIKTDVGQSHQSTPANQSDMKGVKCRTWNDKFTKKQVTVSRVVLRGKKVGNIFLGRSASTLVGIEDMEVSLLFRRDAQTVNLILYAMKLGVHKLQVERSKTLMLLMNDETVMELKPVIDSEYGLNIDFGDYSIDSNLCVYYEISEAQLATLSTKIIKSYRLNTYLRHNVEDTVNQLRAEQVQVAARCMIDKQMATH